MSDEGFLSRWSRRKRAAEAGIPVEEPQAAPVETPAPAEAPAPAAPQEVEEPPFDLASLPSIESLTAESDFAAFLHKAVPEALKRAALRKAWTLDPAIRDFIGLADYAWDYNASDGVPGGALHLSGDVKQMVARLFADAERPPAEVEQPAPEAEAPDAGLPTGDETPIVLAEAPVPIPAPEALESAPVRSEDPIPRRHGSALPS
ncbi:DUF3306 domain-containing protein [Roseomonas sp. HJA6]|uniref:DUF3306 domain-containing protein n=1 Tax=Roseomonas alba TaxID=2846776 RepID=A0ABS7AHP6_9PROT|nr:DUF3306 domain-containing protein [Neoroseomonas alba]MBW6400835.1 DUF3306 domain-containing protein [Neoroseomonas alba]